VEYRYRRESFGELPVRPEHLDIYLDFRPDFVEAVNCMRMTPRGPMEVLELDANGLDILAVEWRETSPDSPGSWEALAYEDRRDRNKLVLFFPRPVSRDRPLWVRTRTRCYPSDHILEGIYKDVTPPGAPQQYMSQCQQWGFQRIMPILDDCRAKCTMTTTLEGDARYTHLISNGNVNLESNPQGVPVPKPGDPRRRTITFENPVPMAPYLFIACAGTWDTLTDRVTYPDGRTVRLEYLVPPGMSPYARVPMEILKKAVLWIRETQDYTYTGDTYRTICMTKSNFGGMENVGNTTIVTDAALVHEHSLDASLLYAHAVIVHEFEHNQCGSETTMDTPFDVWLNEAYTVDVERRFMADRFDPTLVRLLQVDGIRNPLLGPLAIEDGGHVGRVVREGFNDPDELIDGVTYVKAAEIIGMLRRVLGEENFLAGKTLYFQRYRHGNADTDQFFACFEEVSGTSLEPFKKGWLYRIGYPRVTAETSFDPAKKEFHIRWRQEVPPGEAPFHIPIELALVGEDGKDLPGTGQVFQLNREEASLTLSGIEAEPAFASMNRDSSFYGTFSHRNSTPDLLRKQVLLDPNGHNRVDAMRKLTDLQRIRLLEDPRGEIDPRWLDLFEDLLADSTVAPGLQSYLLRIEEQPVDRDYATWYPELAAARETMMRALNGRYRAKLLDRFEGLRAAPPPPESEPWTGLEERMLKNVLLDLIVVDDSPQSHELILDYFRNAANPTDRVAALGALNRSGSPQRRPVLEEVYEAWHGHLSGYANYLRVVAGGTRPDVFDLIDREKRRSTFDITQPTWSRALFVSMAANNKMLWTEKGIRWMTAAIIELAPINQTTTSRMLNAFQHVRRLRPPLRERVLEALEEIVSRVGREASPTVYGQASSYLAGR